MLDNKNSVQVLQDCVDELFALQERVREDQKKIMLESATLIKVSQKQLNEAIELVNQARQSAYQSEQAAKAASQRSVTFEEDAHFWKRLTFWTWLGYFLTGGILALLTWLAGYHLAERQQALTQFDTSVPHKAKQVSFKQQQIL